MVPGICENGLVQALASSRGLVRPSEGNQLHNSEAGWSMLRLASAWRRWRACEDSEILRFRQRRNRQYCENTRQRGWAEFQLGLKTPTTQAEQAALLKIWTQSSGWSTSTSRQGPVYSASIPTPTMLSPLIWSQGLLERWSRSHFSGWSILIPKPAGTGPDNCFVRPWFHRRRRIIFIDGEFLANIWLSQTHASHPVPDKFILERKRRGATSLFRNTVLVIGQLFFHTVGDLILQIIGMG